MLRFYNLFINIINLIISMLDSILGTAKSYINEAVIKNKEVPKEQNSAVSDVIFNAVSKNLTTQLGNSKSGINISQLGNLLGGGNSNSFADSMKKSAIDALVKNAGMKSGIAQSVAATIVPGLINTILSKKSGGISSSPLGNIAGGVLGNILKK